MPHLLMIEFVIPKICILFFRDADFIVGNIDNKDLTF